jgi:hypothetical protein
MNIIMIVMIIVACIMAVPSFVRILCKDYRHMFWSDVFFDIMVVSTAILFHSIVVVVITEVMCNMFIGWIYQQRSNEIYSAINKRSSSK